MPLLITVSCVAHVPQTLIQVRNEESRNDNTCHDNDHDGYDSGYNGDTNRSDGDGTGNDEHRGDCRLTRKRSRDTIAVQIPNHEIRSAFRQWLRKSRLQPPGQ
jgi:hypothetical protein